MSQELLNMRDSWLPVEGFRVVSVGGQWAVNPYCRIVTVEDDGAADDLEGLLVEPTVQRASEPGPDGEPVQVNRVIGRSVISEP